MSQPLIGQAIHVVEEALRRGRLGRRIIEESQRRARALAGELPPDLGEEAARRAVAAHDAMAARLDGIEIELRAYAGRLEGARRERRHCASVGGGSVPWRPRHDGVHHNEDRGGIVVDVRGRQVGWVFDGARRYTGYTCRCETTRHDLQWFGDTLSSSVRGLASRDAGDDLRSVLHDALAQAATDLADTGCQAAPDELWGHVAMTRLDGSAAEVVVVGDCQVALRPQDGDWEVVTDSRIDTLLQETGPDELHRAYEERRLGGAATSPEELDVRQAVFERIFAAHVNRHDVPEDQTGWLVTPADPDVAWKALHRRVTLADTDEPAVLASDGVPLPIGGDFTRTAAMVADGAMAGIEAARSVRGASTAPHHLKPYPDMTLVGLTREPHPSGWPRSPARTT